MNRPIRPFGSSLKEDAKGVVAHLAAELGSLLVLIVVLSALAWLLLRLNL